MTFSRVKALGWAYLEQLTSTQMNTLDTDHADAVDGVNGGTYLLQNGSRGVGGLKFDGSSHGSAIGGGFTHLVEIEANDDNGALKVSIPATSNLSSDYALYIDCSAYQSVFTKGLGVDACDEGGEAAQFNGGDGAATDGGAGIWCYGGDSTFASSYGGYGGNFRGGDGTFSGGYGIDARGGSRTTAGGTNDGGGVFARGGDQSNSTTSGTGVFGRGGDNTSSGAAGLGGKFLGGSGSGSGDGGEGIVVDGGSSTSAAGGVGATITGGESLSGASDSGHGIVATGAQTDAASASRTGGRGISATGGAGLTDAWGGIGVVGIGGTTASSTGDAGAGGYFEGGVGGGASTGGQGVVAVGKGDRPSVAANASVSGYGVLSVGNSTRSPLRLTPQSSAPTTSEAGALYANSGDSRLYAYCTGGTPTGWNKLSVAVEGPYAWFHLTCAAASSTVVKASAYGRGASNCSFAITGGGNTQLDVTFASALASASWTSVMMTQTPLPASAPAYWVNTGTKSTTTGRFVMYNLAGSAIDLNTEQWAASLVIYSETNQ